MNANSATRADQEQRLAQILEQYLADVQKGMAPSRNELLQQYPDLAEDLEACLASLDYVQDAKAAPIESNLEYNAKRTLGDYRIVKEIGRGGMGVVYEAQQISLNRRVALKVLPLAGVLDERRRQRFANEARAAAILHHQNIVPVYQVGCERGVHYYAMQYVEGQTLATLISDLRSIETGEEAEQPSNSTATFVERSKDSTDLFADVATGSVSSAAASSRVFASGTSRGITGRKGFFRTVVRMAVEVAEALDHAHQTGIVHRDIKPSNLLIDANGKLWITDFGLARMDTDVSLTMSGDLLGTVRYMSPEQALAKRILIDHRTDIYSLGATFYELLTLEPLVTGSDREELLRKIAFDEPRSIRRLNRRTPTELGTIISKAISKNPLERYGTAQEMADDLRRFLENEPIRARPPTLLQRATKFATRHKQVVLTATSLVLLALLTGGPLVAYLEHQDRLEADQRAAESLAAANREAELRHQSEVALYRSRLSEVPTLRLARPPGWKQSAIENLQLNAAMDISERDVTELRDEATACLLQLDVRQIAREESAGHSIWSVDFSPDGGRFATAEYNGKVIVREVDNVKSRAVVFDDEEFQSDVKYGGLSPYPAVRFRPDGNGLAFATWGSSVALQQSALPNQERKHIKWNGYQAHAIDFDREGSMIAIVWANIYDGIVTLHDTENLTLLRTIRTTRSAEVTPSPIALSPDGRYFVTTDADHSVLLFDLTNDEPPHNLGRHDDLVTSLSFSPNGKLLASSSHDQTVNIFSVPAGKVVNRLIGHTHRVKCVTFRRDGEVIATASDDGTVRLWEARSGLNITVLHPDLAFTLAVAFDPTGRYLVTSGRGYCLYELNYEPATTRLHGHTYSVSSVAFHPRTHELVSSSWDKRFIKWNLREVGVGHRWKGHPAKMLKRLAMSSDGQLISSGFDDHSNLYTTDYSVRIWEVDSGRRRHLLQGHETNVGAVAFHRSGALFASGDSSGTIIVWDLASGKQQRKWSEPDDPVRTIAFLRDELRLVTAHDSGRIVLRSVNSDDAQGECTLPTALEETALRPDEQFLAVASQDGHIYIVSLPELEIIATIQDAHRGTVEAVAFDSSGLMLASGGKDRQVILWDFPRREVILHLPRRNSQVHDLAFEPSGGRLAICGDEQHITLWDLRSIRDRLAQVGLDWNLPPLPPAVIDVDIDAVPGFEIVPPYRVSSYRTEYNLLGEEGSFVVRDVKGDVEVTPRRGMLPASIQVASRDQTQQSYSFVVERTDTNETRLAAGELTGVEWNTQYFEFECPKISFHPPKDWPAVLATRPVAEENAPQSRRLSPHSEMPKHVAAVLKATLDLSGGWYEVAAAPIEGARVFVNDETVLDLWKEIISGMPEGKISSQDRAMIARQLQSVRHRRYLHLEPGLHEVLVESFSHNGVPAPDFAIRPVNATLLSFAERLLTEASAGDVQGTISRKLKSGGTTALWDLCFRLCVVDLKQDAAQCLEHWPVTGDDVYGAHLHWVLDQLVSNGSVRINCGGQDYSAGGVMWGSDRFYGFSRRRRSKIAIADSEDDELYQTYRIFGRPKEALAGYRIPIPNDSYRVTLHFSETVDKAPGRRLFDVKIEDQTELSNYEPLVAGFGKPDKRTFGITVRDGTLEVSFTPVPSTTYLPSLCAIEIHRDFVEQELE